MTFAPASLLALQTYWRAHGGTSLGIVGDTSHVATGTSYHLGRSQLVAGAYSIQTARDKAGLSEAASAIDLGRLNASYPQLRTFSKWLVAQARVNAPGTSDMREIIYSPDGSTVLRWDRQRGYASAPRAGEADSSHLTHTHISWYRDAEHRDHTTAFRPYFETAGADDMPDPSQYLPGYSATIKATSNVRATPAVTGALIRNITSPETWPDVLGFVKGGTDTDGGCTTDQWLTRWHNGKWEYTSKCNITAGPTAPAGGDCADEVKAATEPLEEIIADLRTTVAGLPLLVAQADLHGRQAEYDRQAAGATVAVVLLPRPE